MAGRCCDVPIMHLPLVWPHVEAFVARALATDPCRRCEPEDVLNFLSQGRVRLWISYDRAARKFDGVAVTEIIQNPRCRECRAWLVAGTNMRAWWREMYHMVEAYARAEGCKYMTGAGRRGWTRFLPGWREAGPMLVKAL